MCMICFAHTLLDLQWIKFAYLVSDVTNTAEPDTEEGTIQLAAGSGPHEGRVEVVFANTWVTLCGRYYWDLQNALVVCRQLGYHTALNATSGTFGEGSGPIWWDPFQCRGNETKLSQCSSIRRSYYYYYYYYYFSCSPSEAAGVICAGK